MKKFKKGMKPSHLDMDFAVLTPQGKQRLEKLLGRFAAMLVIS